MGQNAKPDQITRERSAHEQAVKQQEVQEALERKQRKLLPRFKRRVKKLKRRRPQDA